MADAPDLTLLTAADAAAILGVDVKTFRELPVPYVLVSRSKRYTRVILDEWMSKQKGLSSSGLYLLTEEQIIEASRHPRPEVCGIDFLIKDGKVLYVGQSTNVYWRTRSHRLEKDFDAWHWVMCPRDDLAVMERKYIDLLDPELNRDHRTMSRRGTPMNFDFLPQADGSMRMPDRPLPGWPRVLIEPWAAAYVGLYVSTFRRGPAAELQAVPSPPTDRATCARI